MKKTVIGIVVAMLVLAPGASAQFYEEDTVHVTLRQPIEQTIQASAAVWSGEVYLLPVTVKNFKLEPVTISWDVAVDFESLVVVTLPGGYERTIPGNSTAVYEWEIHPNNSLDWEGDITWSVRTIP